MADADTKIADLKTDEGKQDLKPDAPKKAHPLDEIVKSVEDAPTVHAGVKLMAEKLGDEFASPELQERAGAFADAVKANASDLGSDATLKAPVGDPMSVEDMEAKWAAEPHNDAAASAVAHGMEPGLANFMTAPGSNA